MMREIETEVRRDATGAVDVEYYVAEAKRLRTEMISEVLRNLACRVKRAFKIECSAPMRGAFNQ